MAQTTQAQGEAAKRKRTRSPAYPYINLEGAITRAREFYSKEQRNAANVSVATKHWGFVEDSSNGAQTVAALISFGLMKDEGSGDKRTVRLTQEALRILLDTRPDSSERVELIKQCALAPKIHKQIWDKWGTDLPSDAQLRHTLLFEWETPFNENAVDTFIGEYKTTISFAKLGESDKITEVGRDSTVAEKVKIGDFVQWVSQGMDQFRELKKIKGFSEDGAYAFFEGEKTGAPVGELEIGEAAAPPPIPPPALRNPLTRQHADGGRAMRQDVFSLDCGDVTISWPVPLTAEMVVDIKDWLKIVERKISRSVDSPINAEEIK